MPKPTSYLLERARAEGTPLIGGSLTRDGVPLESTHGDEPVTFVWHGKNPPILTGDFVHWATDQPDSWGSPYTLTRVEPNVWAHTLLFPRSAYIEYDFMRRGKRIGDRFNHRRTPNGIGDFNNYFYVPPGAPTPYIMPDRAIPHGTVTTHTMNVGPILYGGTRKVHLYQPPTSKPAALLVALDGQDYFRRARLHTILDNLFAQKNLNLLDLKKNPAAYGIMGASMSGLMAFYTALRAPQTFGQVISHAGAFDVWDTPTGIYPYIDNAVTKPRVWLDVGTMDAFLTLHRRLFKRLKRLGYTAKYREYDGYHNWIVWRNSLPAALTWAFGK